MAIPSRIIEEIYAKELKAEDYYSVYGKESIELALDELKNSNIQILNKYSVENMHEAVQAKLSGTVSEVKSSKKNNFKMFKIASYAAAAVFVAALALPAGLTSIKSKTPHSTERTKGSISVSDEASNLILYRQKGNEIQALLNGSTAAQGDVIQITYTAGRNNYGVIFSVDGNGNITRHFPANSWNAEVLKHGTDEIPLDFSYELDDAPDYECFIMVSSKQEFSLEDITKKLKEPTNIEYIQALKYLPKKTEAISFVLEK